MNLSIRFGSFVVHCNGASNELKAIVIPAIFVIFTMGHGCFLGKTLLKKGSQRNKVNEDKKEDESKQIISVEPVVRQASEIPTSAIGLDDHQLAGKLMYRGDICLCYGEEHVGKTSIVLNIIIDIVLQRRSHIMADDRGVHTPYHCIWYNGEMDDADFNVFFGNFDRKILDGKLSFINDFTHFSLADWFCDVEKRISSCTDDIVVVLDNLSTISNVTDAEIQKLFSNIKRIQAEMQQKGMHVTFIILGHINKSGDSRGSGNLKNLVSNRIRFSSNGENHTKITVEKNRKYHDMVNKSFNLRWTTSSDGYKSFENLREIVDSDTSAPQKPDEASDGARKRELKYSDKEILAFHNIYEKTGNKSEAEKQTGIPRQTYDKRIKKLIAKGICQPVKTAKD